MFEKEAEEYIKEHSFFHEEFGLTSLDVSCKTIFMDGAEFGYNKALEEATHNYNAIIADYDKRIAELAKANEWHYVKDGDLPNTEFSRADVTVAYINAYENPCEMDCCFDGTNFIYWDSRKPVGWKKADIFGKIYAWKYPEKLPELPKESE